MLDEKDAALLCSKGISLLTLSEDDWQNIAETRWGGRKFSLTFPHEVARQGKRGGLVLVTVAGALASLRLGYIRSIQTVSTFDSRVSFDHIGTISPSSLESLLGEFVGTSLQASASAFGADEHQLKRAGPKLGDGVIRRIASDPRNYSVLQLILAPMTKPTRYEDARGSQQDAVELALKAFGATNGASEIYLPRETALARVRLREDVVIEHDARFVEGWILSESDITGRAIFTQNGERLEVITANKQPLETLLGVDLIYQNRLQDSIVMVQYKMMDQQPRGKRTRTIDNYTFEENDEKEWRVPINSQFIDEVARMTDFDKDLAPDGPYRLNSGAFFLKLVKRYASTAASSIILSLGHFKHLLERGELNGPKDGLRIRYSDLRGHYLRADAFVDLIRSGYIGTRGATTQHLETLIRQTIRDGRSLVFARQSKDETRDIEASDFIESASAPRRSRLRSRQR